MRPEFIADAPAPPPTARRLSFVLVAAGALILCVMLLYGLRPSLLPLVGEETRWATAAREMLANGDWVVTRQQGQVFAERPPMTVWLMAIGGWLRGDVDAIAVRTPSILAIALTSLLVFGYTRAIATTATSRLKEGTGTLGIRKFRGDFDSGPRASPLSKQTATAFVAALAYATFGQVLQIGRLGESEAAFALFVSASLLLWHLGYAHGWGQLFTWTIGFAFAALAALVKGPQAPVYFVAITFVYLAVQRDWRYLFSWQMVVGGFAFVAIVAAWQVPFYLRTDWQHVVATWAGLAGDRFHLWGMLEHAVTYPLETFACLLPWSPMLVALAWPSVRRRVVERYPTIVFLIIATLVAYPTVWFAAGARGRYFMPLYPLLAVLVGLVIECCAAAPRGTAARRAWHRFVLLSGAAFAASGLFLGVSRWLPGEVAIASHQPGWLVVIFVFVAGGAVFAVWSAFHARGNVTPLRMVLAITGVVGLAAVGLMLNENARHWSNPTAAVAGFASHVPGDSQLISLTAIDHRFAYYYGKPITELSWPKNIDDISADVQYFCFMRNPGDKAVARAAGRGRTVYSTPGTLPFAWEEVTAICTDRRPQSPTATSVVLGRVVRPIQAGVSDATKPRATVVSQQPVIQRK